jgi:hypothetical protein
MEQVASKHLTGVLSGQLGPCGQSARLFAHETPAIGCGQVIKPKSLQFEVKRFSGHSVRQVPSLQR